METSRLISATRPLLPALLICLAVSALAQTRISANVGYGSTKVVLAGNPSYHTFINPSLRIDQYLNFRYAITTGIGYWTTGYSTKGYQEYLTQYGNQRNMGVIDNRWQQSMLQIPIGIKAAPVGVPFSLAAGVNLNYTLKSTLWDLKDQDNVDNYMTTDITKAVRPLNTFVFVTMGYSYRAISINYNFWFPTGNWFSTQAVEVADKNAQASNAYWRSWYSTNGHLLQVYPTTTISIEYRFR